jgi:hypothetical protein
MNELLEKRYPPVTKREEEDELKVSKQKLRGALELKGFINLRKF